jgi:hypothetical protein
MSDKEIYHAVIDSITARENLEINGGNDVDDDGLLSLVQLGMTS